MDLVVIASDIILSFAAADKGGGQELVADVRNPADIFVHGIWIQTTCNTHVVARRTQDQRRKGLLGEQT